MKKDYTIDKKTKTIIKSYCKTMNMNMYGLYNTIIKIEKKG